MIFIIIFVLTYFYYDFKTIPLYNYKFYFWNNANCCSAIFLFSVPPSPVYLGILIN